MSKESTWQFHSFIKNICTKTEKFSFVMFHPVLEMNAGCLIKSCWDIYLEVAMLTLK